MLYFCLVIILQIVLESFPVSSSGHNILLERIWNMQATMLCDLYPLGLSSVTLFNEILFHFLHGPTLVVLGIVFFDRIRTLLRVDWTTILSLVTYVVIADGITCCWYLVVKLIGIAWFPLAVGFCVTALALYSLRFCKQQTLIYPPYIIAMILGCVQGIALLPGISRLGSTFVAARWLGISSVSALEISLLLEVPLILAAFVRSFYVLSHYHLWGCVLQLLPVIAIIGATIVSIVALMWVRYLAAQNKMWIFGIYMILPIMFALLW